MNEMVFLVFYLFSILVTGMFISRKFKCYSGILTTFSLGFIYQIGIVELFGWWMVAFRKPTIWFECLVIIVILSGMVLGTLEWNHYQPSKNGLISNAKEWLRNLINIPFVFLCLSIILIGIKLYTTYRSDADDSFYVSNVLLFAHSDQLNSYDSSFGNETFGTVPMYDFQIWESYLAILCRLFSIKATVMCHFLMVFILFLFSVSAYALLGNVLFSSKKKSYWFTVILLLFYVMSATAVYSKGSFLLSRVWQGKAVYLNILLPVTIAYMVSLLNKPVTKQPAFVLSFLLLSGIALNPTSMYVIGFQIICMMIVISIYTKSGKPILQIIPGILTVGLFSLMIYLRTHQYNGQIEAASTAQDGFILNTFINYLGDGKGLFILYLLCCIYIFFFGEIKGKIVCIFTPLVLFVFVWNPIAGSFIAENITMTPSYWRVFWLLPMDFTFAYCGCLLFKRNWKYLITELCLIIAICCMGKYMFTAENNFVSAENEERIPSNVLYFGAEIEDQSGKQIVLANEQASTTLRQEYTNIELIYSRYQYILDLIMYRNHQDEAYDRIQMMEFVNGNNDAPETDYTPILSLLQKYHVQWIIINQSSTNAISFLESNRFQITDSMDGQVLLKASN